MIMPLLLALASLAAASEPSALFDGARGAVKLEFPRRAAAPAALPADAPAQAGGTPVPADLRAAAARVGNGAQLARLPARAAGDSFSFAVLGDIEPGRFWWERVFSPGGDAFPRLWTELVSRGPDFVLQLGDFVSEGDARHYRDHVRRLETLGKPFIHAIGNHDRSRPNGAADKDLYDAVFGARDFFFDHAGWRFIALDSSDRRVARAQLEWLQAALARPGPKVVFMHVPPAYLRKSEALPQVGAVETGELDEKGYLHDLVTNYFKEGAERFEELVRAGGVRSVYMGHIHAFWAADRGGVRYVISGGGGSPLYPLPPGYPKKKFAHGLWVEAYPDGTLRETVVPLEGAGFVLPAPKP